MCVPYISFSGKTFPIVPKNIIEKEKTSQYQVNIINILDDEIEIVRIERETETNTDRTEK